MSDLVLVLRNMYFVFLLHAISLKKIQKPPEASHIKLEMPLRKINYRRLPQIYVLRFWDYAKNILTFSMEGI